MAARKGDGTPADPRLPQVFTGAWPDGPLEDEADITDVELRSGERELAQSDADAVIVESCRLVAVDLHASVLPGIRLTDVVLQECDLSNVRIDGGSLVRVVLDGCRVTGMRLVGGRMSDVVMKQCRGESFVAISARLQRVRIQDCVLPQADWSAGEWEDVAIVDGDLAESDFSGLRAERSTIRTTLLPRVRGMGGLRGIGVDEATLTGLAPDLARHAGIDLLPQ